MIKILIYFDLFLLHCIFEPILHRLHIWSGCDNFWWAKKWFDGVNGVTFVFALFLIVSTKMVLFGISLAFLTMITAASMSMSLWRLLRKRSGRKYLRHAMQRESDSVRYWMLRGKRNPLETALMKARLKNGFFVTILALMSYLFYPYNQTFVIFCTMTIYLWAYVVWLYIRSCTSCTPTVKKHKTRKTTKMLCGFG